MLDQLAELDRQRRELLIRVETLKAERNAASEEVARCKKARQPADDLLAALKRSGEEVKTLDGRLRDVEADAGSGRAPRRSQSSAARRARRRRPAQPGGAHLGRSAASSPSHPGRTGSWATALGLFDLPRGAKIDRLGFPALHRALGRAWCGRSPTSCSTSTPASTATPEIAPPYLVNRATMTGTGQLPKFEDELYTVRSDDLFLIPTAEVPVTNLYRDEILERRRLPIGLVAFTPCFRREAGAARQGHPGADPGASVRQGGAGAPLPPGGQRGGARADDAATPRRCCSGSSCPIGWWRSPRATPASPARRPTISRSGPPASAPGSRSRARAPSPISRPGGPTSASGREPGAKPEFVHTLNASGVAFPRTIIALLENNQQADGSVRHPAGAGAVPRHRPPDARVRSSAAPPASRPRWWWLLVALLAGLSVGSGLIVVRHFRGDATRDQPALRRSLRRTQRSPARRRGGRAAAAGRAGPGAGHSAGRHRRAGRVTAAANLPFEAPLDDPRVRAVRRRLDRENPPIVDPVVGTVHYGPVPAKRQLTALVVLQGLTVARDRRRGGSRLPQRDGRPARPPLGRRWRARRPTRWALRSRACRGGSSSFARGRRRRPAWPTISRPTPSDWSGWPSASSGSGTPIKREPIGLGALADKVAAYFRPRLPHRANPIELRRRARPALGRWSWAIRSCWSGRSSRWSRTRSMPCRGGRERLPCAVGAGAEPGDASGCSTTARAFPRDIRRTLFEPGITTKTGGWGIGLALARRVVEDSHGGELMLETHRPGCQLPDPDPDSHE